MKIRTKLILLLTAAWIVTTSVSTLLRIGWTRKQLEAQMVDSLDVTAQDIAVELQRRLGDADTEADIGDLMGRIKLKHPSVLDLVWKDESDEDSANTFSLGPNQEEPTVKKRPRPGRRGDRESWRTDARRALYDHGQSMRRPGSRTIEPLWRTPDRPESSRWLERGSLQAPPQQRTVRAGERGDRPVYERTLPVDPDGPRRGEVTVAVSREPIERRVRDEKKWAIYMTGFGLLVLVLLTTLIVDRVVARPVGELEQAMKRVEGGALSERVEEERADEVGALSRGFNAMLSRLHEADQEIRAFNRRLADEVQAATIDLARKNDALGQLNRLLSETRRELGDKERLAALGQLAAQLAHEIGTPLGSISGHLQLAMVGRDVPGPLKERLQVATSEVARVSKIVRDYLDSTRTVAPERVPVDVGRVMDEAVGIVLGPDGRPGVEIARSIDPDAAEVKTDPGLLRQILINLCTNAADAISHREPDGRGRGRVELSARALGGGGAGDAGAGGVEIAVRDDGVGIAAEDLARIFEPFYTTKGRGKGTGLGLAICRELASALAGRLTVESTPGRGSIFRLTLPGDGTAQRQIA
jgi:signal transduction histidine kinase